MSPVQVATLRPDKGDATALRESEERLREFGQALQDMLWIRDAETQQWQ